jgi:hypothetical protein
VSRFAQGTDYILVAVTHLQGFEQGGGFANDHIDDRNGAFFNICLGHGQWNALAILIGFENNKLAGFGLAGNFGRFDLIEDHIACGHFFAFDYFEHFKPPTEYFLKEYFYALFDKKDSIRPAESAHRIEIFQQA